MSVFKSEKLIGIVADDLAEVVEELCQHFRDREYDVSRVQSAPQTWDVTITKGGMFKAVLGLKTALKIQVTAREVGTQVNAGVGIFGRQAVPTAISMLVFWPVLITQIWGIVRQAGLDDEAIKVVEVSLSRRSRLAGHHIPADVGGVPAGEVGAFCTGCGRQLVPDGLFCSGCGQARPVQSSLT